MFPFYRWGRLLMWGPGLQNVLLCHIEPSPLKTRGSLSPLWPHCTQFPGSWILANHTALGSTCDASTLVPSSAWHRLSGMEWRPPSTPFRSLTHTIPSQQFFLLLYFTLQTHPKYSPSPFSVLFYPQHWSLSDSLLSFLSDQYKKKK